LVSSDERNNGPYRDGHHEEDTAHRGRDLMIVMI
jgi:hypothetical protein